MVQSKIKRNLSIGRIKVILLVSVSFLIISCTQKDKTDTTWKIKNYEASYFDYENGEILFYDGNPINQNFLKGNIHFNRNQVVFNSSNFLGLSFVLFDFQIKKGQYHKISYSKNKVFKTYLLKNQDVFYDKSKNDTVYKFEFKNYGLINPETGIVFFVGKKTGVLGHYYADYSKKTYSISEKTYGEIFSNRYDYTVAERFSIK